MKRYSFLNISSFLRNKFNLYRINNASQGTSVSGCHGWRECALFYASLIG